MQQRHAQDDHPLLDAGVGGEGTRCLQRVQQRHDQDEEVDHHERHVPRPREPGRGDGPSQRLAEGNVSVQRRDRDEHQEVQRPHEAQDRNEVAEAPENDGDVLRHVDHDEAPRAVSEGRRHRAERPGQGEARRPVPVEVLDDQGHEHGDDDRAKNGHPEQQHDGGRPLRADGPRDVQVEERADRRDGQDVHEPERDVIETHGQQQQPQGQDQEQREDDQDRGRGDHRHRPNHRLAEERVRRGRPQPAEQACGGLSRGAVPRSVAAAGDRPRTGGPRRTERRPGRRPFLLGRVLWRGFLGIGWLGLGLGLGLRPRVRLRLHAGFHRGQGIDGPRRRRVRLRNGVGRRVVRRPGLGDFLSRRGGGPGPGRGLPLAAPARAPCRLGSAPLLLGHADSPISLVTRTPPPRPRPCRLAARATPRRAWPGAGLPRRSART